MRPFHIRVGNILEKLILNIFLIFYIFKFTNAQVLTPPYFNLAEGRRIVATATCGEDVPEPELYCKLVGADTEKDLHGDNFFVQGQFCDYCDPKNPTKRHPSEYAVDGRKTWWQSPPLSRGMSYNEINLTIDLGQEFHVAYVIVKMGNSPRPGVWALERSNDNGQTYWPWQYFADTPGECQNMFGMNVNFHIEADDTVICTTQYSKIVPLEGGEIVVPLVKNRPSANDFFNSTVLQEWTRATNVRFRLIRVKNLLGHLMSIARQDTTTTRRYYYSIEDISIGGRCRCNGHADTCTSIDQNDPYKLVCDCKDNTCGPNCETCCPGFEQKKWSQSKTNKKFVCERCNCFGHSDQCVYNETIDHLQLSLDLQNNYEGGGVCQNCQHNTEGINCNKCKHGYYRPYGKQLDETDVCRKCQCDNAYSTGNCEDSTGRCECKEEYTKPNCDSCSFGHYGYPICRPCECFVNGTASIQCQAKDGQCPCKNNFGGKFCRFCAEGFYDFPECKACECNNAGSVSNVCDLKTGECKCKNSYGGRSCNECSDGYYSFPSCAYCNCDIKGTLMEICDKKNGQCLCKPGYSGPRCDLCAANFTGFPNCKPCSCSSVGSAFTVCDSTGKCTCLPNFAGKLCDQCYPGFYNYPNCTACMCNSEGSIGVTCNNAGFCQCKPNFDGDKCGECRKGFYNFPICEECNFDPAGVESSFTGCSSGTKADNILCKQHVQGKHCGECKELYWNLQKLNVEGCETCDCNTSGTIGSLASCHPKTGQCICKPSTTSRRCDQCIDGYYNLEDSNLFGCADCECDVGGSLSNICDKKTGQCMCQPRVIGKNCKKPLETYYFPTLHQYQYEIEDGKTPESTPVRYGFDEAVFPGYSWKGYAVFSVLQNETFHDIMIEKPSIYRVILRYINLNNQPISGTISVNPEFSSNLDTEQRFQVLFKPSRIPAFVTVAGIHGNNPSPFVMNPGPWLLKIKNEKSLFLDYFVLIPAEYYEASLLVFNVTNPCTVDKIDICRHFIYPVISSFDQKKGFSGYIRNVNNQPSELYIDNFEESFEKKTMLLLSDSQPQLNYDMTLTHSGLYVLIISYMTTQKQTKTTIQIDVRTQNTGNKGVATIYNCRYTTLCREVILDQEGKVAIFNFDSNYVNLILRGNGDGIGIESITAIPFEKWSLDYIQPKPSCIRKDNKCVLSSYLTPPDSKRIDFKTGNENRINKTLPRTIFDNSTELIFLNYEETIVNISGKVPKQGSYIFVIHYYQPDFPEFEMDVKVLNGQSYEAKLQIQHCPNNIGCRALVKQTNGNIIFQLIENVILSLKESNQKNIWLHYVLIIPSSQYTSNVLTELPFDQTSRFISQCGHNSFYLDVNEEGFCRDATFSLTTKYNHGTLPCHCDFEGSKSFECAQFGGQCPCQNNVIGRRCDTCKTGYFGFPNCQSCNCSSTALCDPNTGECVCPHNVHGEKCNHCIQYTFGFDPIIGCQNCNCHIYGVKNNELQCNIIDGTCNCKENVEGRTCDRCSAGYWKFPDCKTCECDLRGTTEDICNQTTASCFCKENVHGLACDVCKDGTFNLQPDNSEGCTKCFCFGKTSRCSSSALFVTTISTLQNWTLANINFEKSIIVEELPAPVTETESVSVNFGLILGGITYFVAPSEYLGNRLTSYGNSLNYTIFYTGQDATTISGADVIFYGANMYLLYESFQLPVNSAPFVFSIKIAENNFLTISKTTATREELMQVLQNLTAIYIKASYAEKGEITKLMSVSFEIAAQEYYPSSKIALSIEQCHCPPNYAGLSCEECADGYYRVPNGPFGGYCVPCQCNGHASNCDKETGICYNCKHNTKGDHCEKCEVGFYGNATVGAPNDCLICACPLPISSNNFATSCDINDLGDKIICDCIPGYTGEHCEKCGPGYYGRPKVTGEVCVACQCNGNIDPNEFGNCDHETGKCIKCLNNTYGDSCEKCAPGFFGDAVSAKNCQPCICDKCGTKECNHITGECICHENIVGEKCDRCLEHHYGFTTCQGCTACKCGIASEGLQCDDLTGFCRCKEGVTGRTCDKCVAGYWKYTENGCTSCGCISGYSIGVGCNITTGLCECLPGVVGEKCDRCPHRHVLIPNEGCFGCDKCIDGLLDVTDEIRTKFRPMLNQFKTENIGYFTVQRLKYINETYKNLSSKVSDILSMQFDTTVYDQNISAIESETENIRRKILSVYNDATSSIKKGNLAFENGQKIEALIMKTIDKSRLTVLTINNLAYSLETTAGPQIDYAIQEAQNIIQSINYFDLDEEKKTQTNEVYDKAKIILINATNFSSPLNQTVLYVEDVKNKTDTLDNKLNELENYTESAQKTAAKTTAVNQAHKNANLAEKVRNVDEIALDANKTLSEVLNMSKNTTLKLDAATINFEKLEQSSQSIKTLEVKANEYIEKLKADLNSELETKNSAINHANDLEKQAQILESSRKKSVSSDHALQAATAYKDIISTFNDAVIAVKTARENVNDINEKTRGIKDKILKSETKSLDLKETARQYLEDVQRQLELELNTALQRENLVSFTINKTEANITDIYKQIKDEKTWNDKKKKKKNLNADNISIVTRNKLNSIQEIKGNLPKKLTEAKQLYEDRNNKKKFLLQANSYLEKTELYIPQMNKLIENLNNKPEKLDKSVNNINEVIEMLQQKISATKDLAAKIKVGVTLYPNTRASLELPIPAKLLEQGSSTDLSFYFKTNQSNALLLYLGNEMTRNQKRETNSSKIRRPKTDDFLAIEIKNGHLLLSIDLGEKNVTTASIIEKSVNDNKWYNVKVERTGKLVNLSLTEEIRNPLKSIRMYKLSWTVFGFHSVLNINKENSKFFIGGIPISFEAPSEIKYNTFAGQIEELMIESIPIGLWNFIDISSPQNLKPSKIMTGAVERDTLINTERPTGCRFDGDGYVKLLARGYVYIDRSDIVLRFKTTATDGLLFLMFKNDIFISIELRGGYIYYQYNVGKGIVSLHTPSQYNDAKWHIIEANRYHNEGLLKVDNNIIQKEASQEKITNFELPEYIDIGGHSKDHKINEVTKVRFEGCIDGVQINGQGMDINRNQNSHGIIPGCPEKFFKFVSFNDGDLGYVQWPRPNVKYEFYNINDIEVTLRIKTKAKDGLIAYGSDGAISFYLLLMDGGIIFKIGSVEVNTGSNIKYNDDKWHAIAAFHDSNFWHLLIDDFDMFKSSVSVSQKKFVFPGKLFFGSVPVEVDASAAYEKAFVGCIGDASFNGIVINFDEIAEGKAAAIGRCSGPGQEIKSSINTLEPTIIKSPPVDTTLAIPLSTSEPSVTVAPGCLPIHPAADPDLTKESGYRFGTVKYSAQTYDFDQLQFKNEIKLSIDMKTVSENGIIFYVTQPQKKDFFALYLKDSKIYFKYSCIAKSALLSSDMNVNQGEWHNIQFEVNQNQGLLTIDGKRVDDSLVGCKPFNIGSPYYLGGMDTITLETATEHLEGFNKTFIGCLRNFRQNDKMSSNPSTSTGVIPCSSKVEPGTFFSAKGGYVKIYERFKVGKQIEIKMEIKPRNNSGLLMAVHSKKDYLVLQMVNGAIKFTVENGNGPVSNTFKPPSPYYFCDNQWHRVMAVKNKNVVILKVDEQQTPISMDSGVNTATDTNNPLYVGGYPSSLAKSKDIEVDPQFVGCIKNLEINQKEEQLSLYTAYENVMFNVCPTI